MTPQQNMNTFPTQSSAETAPYAPHSPAAPVEAVTANDLLSDDAQAAIAELQKHAEMEARNANPIIFGLRSMGSGLAIVRNRARGNDDSGQRVV